jgi:AAA family ATP:ADP antiporter
MNSYVEKTFNLRRNEFAPVSLLFLFLFVAIGSYVMGGVVGDALILSAFKKYLPQVIIATAVPVAGLTSVYIRLSHRLRVERLMIYSLLFFGMGLTLLWSMFHYHEKWAFPLLYIWVCAIGSMAPTMGWTLANYVLTTREAKRVFGFVGGGAALGAPCAGFLTADLVRQDVHHASAVRPETLLLVMAVLMGLCALLAQLVFRQLGDRLPHLDLIPAESQLPRNLRQVWAHIRKSRYLLLVTALIAIGCATTTIIAWQFKIIASNFYGDDKVAMTVFFGRFQGYLGLGTFVLQILLTGRLLRWFGVRITLFVLPMLFLAGSFAVLLAPILLTACILKGSHNLFRYSLDKSSTELLYLPVAPPNIKNQIKSFIDGFVWRGADGVAGVVLLLFANLLHFTPGRMSLVGIAFILVWLVTARGVRREYLTVLRQAIERRTLDPEKTAAAVLDSTTIDILAQALERGGEQQVLYGLSLFDIGREAAWHPALTRLLQHPSPVVRQRALQVLTHVGKREILPQVEKMLGDDSLEVRAEALRYLAAQGGKDPLVLLSEPTGVPAHCLQSAIVVYLARTGDQGCLAAAELILQAMLVSTDHDAPASRREAARALGLIPPPSDLHAELLGLLRDDHPEVVEQALLSAGRVHGREFLPLVIEKLGEPRLRAPARAALAEYGPRAVDLLSDRLNDDAAPVTVRQQIPRVLARIRTPEAAQVLADRLIQSDPTLRYEIVKALTTLRAQDPALVPVQLRIADMLEFELVGYYRSFQILAALGAPERTADMPHTTEPLLTRALRERMGDELERIFSLLALLYSPRDIHNAYVGINSGRREVQANALELLENLLPHALYKQLISVMDPESNLQEKLAFAERICRTQVASRDEAMRVLLFSTDRWLCACALHAVGEAQMANLLETVRQVPHEKDPLLDQTWKWTCSRLMVTDAA